MRAHSGDILGPACYEFHYPLDSAKIMIASPFAANPGDSVSYSCSINYGPGNLFKNVTFTFTDIYPPGYSARIKLFFKNETYIEDTWHLMQTDYGYTWWQYFPILIPFDLKVGDKIGSVYEYVQGFHYFDLFINETVQEEWLGCLRQVIVVSRTWSIADWTHTVIAKYDEACGIAYSLYESWQTQSYTYIASFTMIGTTCKLSDASPPSITDLTYSPKTPTPDSAVEVTASVTDVGSGVKSVILKYSIDGGGTWTDVTMTSGSTYTGTIPKQADGTTVQYKIKAEDNAGNIIESSITSYTVHAPTPEIPGFPIEAVLAGIVMATVALTLLKKKQSTQKPTT